MPYNLYDINYISYIIYDISYKPIIQLSNITAMVSYVSKAFRIHSWSEEFLIKAFVQENTDVWIKKLMKLF